MRRREMEARSTLLPGARALLPIANCRKAISVLSYGRRRLSALEHANRLAKKPVADVGAVAGGYRGGRRAIAENWSVDRTTARRHRSVPLAVCPQHLSIRTFPSTRSGDIGQ